MSDVYASKKIYYGRLREQLRRLDANLSKLESNLKTTNEQVPSIRKMGTLHSSMLMSVQSTMNHQDTNDNIKGSTSSNS